MFVPLRVISPIDGKSMESISSTKMFQKSEYKENGKIIRWTEVHIMICLKYQHKFIWNCFLPLRFSVMFYAGVLPAEGESSQRGSVWLRWTQPVNRADRPGVLLGTVSTPQAVERGRDGQTGAACRLWISRGQKGCSVLDISELSHNNIMLLIYLD